MSATMQNHPAFMVYNKRGVTAKKDENTQAKDSEEAKKEVADDQKYADGKKDTATSGGDAGRA